MAIYAAVGSLAPGLIVAGTDLSDHVKSIQTPMQYDQEETTAMGAEAHQFVQGLRNDSIVVEFFQDFAASKVEQTLNTFLTAGGTVVAYANGTTASGTAPKYTLGPASMFGFTPINLDSPGSVSTTGSVTFTPAPGCDGIVRGTS